MTLSLKELEILSVILNLLVILILSVMSSMWETVIRIERGSVTSDEFSYLWFWGLFLPSLELIWGSVPVSSLFLVISYSQDCNLSPCFLGGSSLAVVAVVVVVAVEVAVVVAVEVVAVDVVVAVVALPLWFVAGILLFLIDPAMLDYRFESSFYL